MSALQEVQDIIAEVAGVPPAKAKENVSRAHMAEEFYFVLVSRLPLWDLMIWSGGSAWGIFFLGRVRVFLFGI